MSERIKIKATVNSIARRGELDELINQSGVYTNEVLSNFITLKGIKSIFIDPSRHPILIEILKERLRVEKEIGDKYKQFTWFGTPITGVEEGPGDGYYRHFQLGSIFWTPTFGAKEVHGAIREKYDSFGGAQSYFGYPTTDELSALTPSVSEARYSNFMGGTINWSPTRGAYLDLSIDIRTERHQLGGWIHISGKGFTPNSLVSMYADGLIRFVGSLSLGSSNTKGDGRFNYVYDARIQTGQFDSVTIRAVDTATGAFATNKTSAFGDPNPR